MEVTKVATMAAQGIRPGVIADALAVGDSRIKTILKMPETQTQILEFSDLLKQRTVGHIYDANDPAWEFAKDAIRQRDAKAYDAVMRGLASQERIRASVTGEANRRDVDLNVTGDLDVQSEVRALIGILVGKTDGQG